MFGLSIFRNTQMGCVTLELINQPYPLNPIIGSFLRVGSLVKTKVQRNRFQ